MRFIQGQALCRVCQQIWKVTLTEDRKEDDIYCTFCHKETAHLLNYQPMNQYQWHDDLLTDDEITTG